MKRNLSIDIIRIVSIMLIVQFHYCIAMGDETSFFYITANGGWGSIGTSLFFMISGFVLCIKDREVKNLKIYYKKRFLAIYPMTWLAFLIAYIYQSIKISDFTWGGKGIWRLIYSFLCIDGYVGFWGIDSFRTVGEWFTTVILILYIIFPILTFFLKSIRRKIGCTIVLVVACYANMALDLWPMHPDATIFNGLLLFWVGMLLQEYIGRFSEKKYILSLAGLCIFLMLYKMPTYKYSMPWRNLLAFALFVVLFYMGSLIDKVIKDGPRKVINYLGGLTFAIYLSHHVIINEMASAFRPYINTRKEVVLLYMAVWGIILVISVLLHLFVSLVNRWVK